MRHRYATLLPDAPLTERAPGGLPGAGDEPPLQPGEIGFASLESVCALGAPAVAAPAPLLVLTASAIDVPTTATHPVHCPHRLHLLTVLC